MSRTHASKRSAQNTNNSTIKTPIKSNRDKTSEAKSTPNDMDKNLKSEVKLEDLYEIISDMSKKLDKLDIIQENMQAIEQDLKEVKKSIEYAHKEIDDLKKENVRKAQVEKESTERIQKLEADNAALMNSVIDLKARSMRDNLLFYNLPENRDENTTEVVQNLLAEKLGLENAKNIKIDRSHRLGKKKSGESKPRPIVAKFNFHQDKVTILQNARKLKGTQIGISEQFPEEIAKERKRLYPELKKARSNGMKANLVRDKLFINGELFRRCKDPISHKIGSSFLTFYST